MWYNWQRAQRNCYEESKQVTGKQTSKQKKFNELRKKFNKQKDYWTKEIEFDLNHKEFQSLQKDTTDSGTEELNKMKNTLESIRNTEDHMGKRWQEYTEELWKNIYNPDNQDGVITHREPDILQC